MQFGLTVSILMHLAILAWAFLSLQSPEPFRVPEPEPVEVALVTPEDIVRLKKGDRSAKQLEAQQADNQKKAVKEDKVKSKHEAAAPPPPPPPEATPPPEPAKDPIAEKIAALPPEPKGPSPEELKRKEEEAALKAEEARKAAEKKKAEEEKRLAEEKKKAEEAKKKAAEAKKKEEERRKRLAEQRRKEQEAKEKKRFDADRIAALLNKVPDRAPAAGAPEPPTTETKARGPVAGAPEGTDSRLTASQRSLLGVMMKRAVSRCWNINSGLDGIDRIVVEVEVRLRPDGYLEQPPRVINSGYGPLFADAANSAIRALVQCEPYDLPAHLYAGGWDHMVVTFDPQRMF